MCSLERKWWTFIILASVLSCACVRCINSKEPNKILSKLRLPMPLPDRESTDNFDTINLGNQDSIEIHNIHVRPGETTRIETSGEVDNNFWLKHLGDEFKYAVHVQLNDEPHNGIYNMKENIGHHYRIEEIPVISHRNNYAGEQFKIYEDFYPNAERWRKLIKKHSAPNTSNKNQIVEDIKHTKTVNYKNKIVGKQHEPKNTNTKAQEQQKQVEPNQEKQNENQNPLDAKNATQCVENVDHKNTSIGSTEPHTTPSVSLLSNDTKSNISFDDEQIICTDPPVINHQTHTYLDDTTAVPPTTMIPNTENTVHDIQQRDHNTAHEIPNSIETAESNENTTENPALEDSTSIHQQSSVHLTEQNTIQRKTIDSSTHPIYLQMPSSSSQFEQNSADSMEATTHHIDSSFYPSSPSFEGNSKPSQSPNGETDDQSTEVVHFILRKPSISTKGEVTHQEILMGTAI